MIIRQANEDGRGRRKLPLRTLQETREAIEPVLANLAAQRRNDEDLRELKALHEQLVEAVGNFQEFALINIKWHNAVARASGNELLAAVLYSISYGLHVATTAEEYDTMDTRREVVAIHGRINDAIESGNAELADKRMRQRIGATHSRAVVPGTRKIPLSSDK